MLGGCDLGKFTGIGTCFKQFRRAQERVLSVFILSADEHGISQGRAEERLAQPWFVYINRNPKSPCYHTNRLTKLNCMADAFSPQLYLELTRDCIFSQNSTFPLTSSDCYKPKLDGCQRPESNSSIQLFGHFFSWNGSPIVGCGMWVSRNVHSASVDGRAVGWVTICFGCGGLRA